MGYLFFLLIALGVPRAEARAQAPVVEEPDRAEDRELGWSNVADLGFVLTSGNADTSALSLNDKLTRAWRNAELSLRFGALRTKTANDPVAVGTPGAFRILEDDSRELDNERYYVSGRYDRNISARFFWVAGAGWDRDKDAGIENRAVVYGGVGNTWRDDEHMRFKTDYAITFTRRVDDIVDPDRDERFSEARLAADYMHELGANTQLDSDSVFFANVNDANDYRFNTLNAVTTSLNSVVALRFGVQLIYQNRPALEAIPLFDRDPTSGGVGIGSAVVRKDKLDSILRFSLVITF